MNKTQLPANFVKHTSNNLIQKLLINNFYKTLITLIKPLSPTTILDAGCGEGFTLQKLREHCVGEKLEGIEYSKKAIKLGKKIFPNLSLKQGSIYQLPYRDNSFELVLCTEVLEHIDRPSAGLEEVIRVSQKYIILSIPNEPFFMISNLLRGKNIRFLGNDPEHINHWTIFSFKRLLKENSITIKKVSLPFPWIMILGEKN